jgi:hypothetical protein
MIPTLIGAFESACEKQLMGNKSATAAKGTRPHVTDDKRWNIIPPKKSG